MNLHISTFRIGDPPKRDEGLRVGATRLPPRGVPKSRWKKDGYFDVWLPTVAPGRKLLGWIKQRDINDDKTRRVFFARYEHELLGNSETRQTLSLLAELAKRTPISVGCFCADESHCHRSRLHEVIKRLAKAE